MAAPIIKEYEPAKEVMKPEPVKEPQIEDIVPPREREKFKVDTIELTSKLPSLSKTYPPGHKIFYKTYSYSEVRKFSNKNISFPEHCKLIMEGITTVGFDKWELTFFDFMYIAVLRKLSSLRSPKFKIPYTCSKCGADTYTVFKVEDIDFNDLEVELPVNLHIEGETYKFNPLTIKSYLSLTDPTDAASRLAICCTSHKFEDAHKLIKSDGDIDNFVLFEQIENALFHGIKPFEFKCVERVGEYNQAAKDAAKADGKVFFDDRPICDKEYITELDGGELLILPFRESEDVRGNRISFGVPQAD